MTTYKTTITSIAVHINDEPPIFGESTTNVRIADDAAGVYIVIDQSGSDDPETGIVKLNPEELPVIMDVAQRLLDQETLTSSSAAPAAPQPAQQPLTDEQIKDIHWSKPMDEFQFARAIEQAATAPLLARIAELEAKLAEAQKQMERQKDEWLAWDEKREGLEKDAERYRWLRDRWGRVTDTYDGDSGRVVEIGTEPDGEGWDVDASSLDAAIDAEIARAATGNAQGGD